MTKRGFRPVAASQLSSRCPMSPEATKNSLSSVVQAELPQKVPWLECIEASAETGVRIATRGSDGRVREKLAAGVVLRSGGRSAFGGKPENICSLSLAAFDGHFGSIHLTCLSALVTDRAMEAWYHCSIA